MDNAQQEQDRTLELIKPYMFWYKDTQDHPRIFEKLDTTLSSSEINKIADTMQLWKPKQV